MTGDNTAESELRPAQGLSDPDLELSHAMLNFLNAGYQGRFAFQNILRRLHHSQPYDEELQKTKDTLAQTNGWIHDLWHGGAILNHLWREPKTFPAKQLIEQLQSLRDDLRGIAEDLQWFYLTPNIKPDSDMMAFLIGCFGWFAYGRDNYNRGFIEYGKKFEHDELVENFEEKLQLAEADVRRVHELMEQAADPTALEGDFFERLLVWLLPLPANFASNVHDLNILLYKWETDDREFQYAHTDIPPEAAQGWIEFGCPPAEAGYWVAHGFLPEEAVLWKSKGVIDFATAFTWRCAGHDPYSAGPWIENGFNPNQSNIWQDAGFDSDRARHYVDKGIEHPNEVPEILR